MDSSQYGNLLKPGDRKKLRRPIRPAEGDLNSNGQLLKPGNRKKLRRPIRPAENIRATKGLQERTHQIEWDGGET